MPTLRSDQPPVNTPKAVSTQVSSTRMPARPPAAIGARTPGMATGAPLPGTPTNPGLSADQPVPSIGATRPMATAQPKPPSKPAKTGLEGLTRQASLQPGRRKEILDILSKHADRVPSNCALLLVEKLVEKHAELALSGVTKELNKAAMEKMLKQAFLGTLAGATTGAMASGEDRRAIGALGGAGGGLLAGQLGSLVGLSTGAIAGALSRNPQLGLALAALLSVAGNVGGGAVGGHYVGKAMRKQKPALDMDPSMMGGPPPKELLDILSKHHAELALPLDKASAWIRPSVE